MFRVPPAFSGCFLSDSCPGWVSCPQLARAPLPHPAPPRGSLSPLLLLPSALGGGWRMSSRTLWDRRWGWEGQPAQKTMIQASPGTRETRWVPQNLCLCSRPAPPGCSKKPPNCQEAPQSKGPTCCVPGAVSASWLLTGLPGPHSVFVSAISL